ncbi:TPA: DNA cytosine methyltransferase [Salmonella enterica]|uniref:DNA cytosine methyltransferase n=1 Tax=Salmonella enterica TaxID=28901 RepID=A0A757YE92_SALER|nr:DNA cytosine methyltransferase [Salmonella enterica]EBV6528340.1 DNA cytosine methyltransferase [Salmonella enterica subsp. enterica serovar Oranienburg]EEJ7315025.1 DNA cytosine methyltransferase [Salmonella enterica subsp. enterica serovar Braenderup]EJG2874172.1 DNA cytosine methyltransferase [Salmonella enterica subsp. enterica serovar Norwich]EAP0003255.1 DNA cytosine methyltransferase [Salmonella enterica]
MTATAYYNEIDPFAAAWLQNLIDAGCIAPGVVDTRSIEEVTANDLKGFTQCHFFAGIGVWSYALRCAGWPDSRPVWTGSCPCQPFSQSGKRRGFNDPRHLWPTWRQLIKECTPYVIFGEQVASKDGLTWFDAVQLDLEEAEYAVAVIDLCAAGFGAPHIRQRLFWVADAAYKQRQECLPGREESHCPQSGRSPAELTGYCLPDGLAHTNNDSSKRRLPGREDSPREVINGSAGCGSTDSGTCPVNGYWRDADWLFCRDGKWRPVKPGIKPLVNGTPGRVGQLRAYGNAIVVPVAEAFIRAYMEAVTP